MSSDYIPRLRSELLRAAATEQARRPRPARVTRRLRPLAAAAAVALVLVAVVLAIPGTRSDDKPVPPAATAQLSLRVTPGASEPAAQTVRARLAAAGISPAFVSTSRGRVAIAVPPADRAAADTLLAPGRLAVLYWEGSVLGPDGRTAPGEEAVTGGADAGRAGAVSKADARARAAKHPDARVVRAESGDGWFALARATGLTNSGLAGARPAVDPATQEPIVALELNEQGRRAFQDLTREVAQGGADYAEGGDPLATSHHLAIVVDDRILSVPFINWQLNPDGIDGARGAQILVATAEEARLLAAILDAGPIAGAG